MHLFSNKTLLTTMMTRDAHITKSVLDFYATESQKIRTPKENMIE